MLLIPKTVKAYALEDIQEAIKIANRSFGSGTITLGNLDFERNEDNIESDVEEYTVYVTAELITNIKGEPEDSFDLTWEYIVTGDDVYVSGDPESIAESILNAYEYHKHHLTGSKKIYSNTRIKSIRKGKGSTRIKNKYIVAAEGDELEEDDESLSNNQYNTGEGFEADFAESVDDLADTAEELQDAIEDIEEDDVDIEIDNNIADHYIAECDICLGVFISATEESNQEVEKTAGICPLCGKESEQYLKWVIKSI